MRIYTQFSCANRFELRISWHHALILKDDTTANKPTERKEENVKASQN